MRVFVKLNVSGKDSCFYVIPCKNLRGSVASLKEDILSRRADINTEGRDASLYRLALAGSGAILSDKDIIEEVVRDGDVLQLCEHQILTYYLSLSYSREFRISIY